MLSNDERDALRCVSEILVEIRLLARQGGDIGTIEALADAVHNTPRLIADGDSAMSWLVASEQQRAKSVLRGAQEHASSAQSLCEPTASMVRSNEWQFLIGGFHMNGIDKVLYYMGALAFLLWGWNNGTQGTFGVLIACGLGCAIAPTLFSWFMRIEDRRREQRLKAAPEAKV